MRRSSCRRGAASCRGCWTTAGTLLAGCSGNSSLLNSFTSPTPPPQSAQAPAGATIGTGQVKAGLILPLSARRQCRRRRPGDAQRRRNGARRVQCPQYPAPGQGRRRHRRGGAARRAAGARRGRRDHPRAAVRPIGQRRRAGGARAQHPGHRVLDRCQCRVRGVYLLSFLPESDVERIVQYAASTGKRSYAALIPDNPYGTVVEAAFKQAVARRNGQIVAIEHYPHDKAAMAGPVRNVAQAAARTDALFIPDGGDAVPDVVQAACERQCQYSRRSSCSAPGCGTIPRISSNPALDGGWYAAPDGAGYRDFADRYRARYKQEPVPHRDAGLRRGRPDRGPGEDARDAAFSARQS